MNTVVHDYYAVLGLEGTANRAQIKKAYRDLAKLHHPDKKNIHKKTFGEIQADLDGRRISEAADFRLVQQAWEILSEADSRKEYDAELAAFRNEQAKLEKRQARERAKREKKEQEEKRKRLKKEKKEPEQAAREAAIQELAEMKAEQEFLENLYTDFGEDDSIAFELRNLKELIAERMASDPELGARISNPRLSGTGERRSITMDPELEDISNNQTPSRSGAKKGRRNAEVWSADPELDPSSQEQSNPRLSPHTVNLMAQINKAMQARLSDPRMSDPRLSGGALTNGEAFVSYQDPDLFD